MSSRWEKGPVQSVVHRGEMDEPKRLQWTAPALGVDVIEDMKEVKGPQL